MPPGQSFFKYANPRIQRHNFLEVYGFVHDRIRQLVKDMTYYEKECFCDLDKVRATEEMVRFLIISYHDGYFFQHEGFDMVQNSERVTMSLSILMDEYKTAKLSYETKQIDEDLYNQLVKNRAEFTSYLFIATAT